MLWEFKAVFLKGVQFGSLKLLNLDAVKFVTRLEDSREMKSKSFVSRVCCYALVCGFMARVLNGECCKSNFKKITGTKIDWSFHFFFSAIFLVPIF